MSEYYIKFDNERDEWILYNARDIPVASWDVEETYNQLPPDEMAEIWCQKINNETTGLRQENEQLSQRIQELETENLKMKTNLHKLYISTEPHEASVWQLEFIYEMVHLVTQAFEPIEQETES